MITQFPEPQSIVKVDTIVGELLARYQPLETSKGMMCHFFNTHSFKSNRHHTTLIPSDIFHWEYITEHRYELNKHSHGHPVYGILAKNMQEAKQKAHDLYEKCGLIGRWYLSSNIAEEKIECIQN